MPKILLIEDEKDFRRLYRKDLETEGYSVVTARSQTAGLDILDEVSPDMVLYDIDEVDMESFLAMRQFQGHCPRVPVVLVLDESESEDSPICSAADAYVRRSRNTRPLRTTIRQMFSPEIV
jgi:CheY-like chemotaxis protein